jgi:photosystem II stability/assembly factor-like uncharacterized protein
VTHMNDTKELLQRARSQFPPPEDVMESLRRRRDLKRRNRRIGTIVLALAVAAAAIGGIVEAIRRAEPSTRPANLPPEAWSRLRPDPAPDGVLVSAGPGLVAVGASDRAEVWTSSDGRTWTRVPGQQLGPGSIWDVTAGGPGLVAVGTNDNETARILGQQTPGPVHAVIWTSENGLTWTRLPDDPVFRDTPFATAVVAGGPGVVAVGAHNVAWFSSDGTTWDMAAPPPIPADVYPGDDGRHPQIYLTDVAASSDHLVAIGWAMLNDNSEVPVIWASADGTRWANVLLDPEVFPLGGAIRAVAGGPDGFVAIGSLSNERPAIWTSADGEHWRLVWPGRKALASPLTLNSVTAGDGGYVAVGTGLGEARYLCANGDENCAYDEAIVLTSVDGETWVRVPSAPVFRVGDPRDPEGHEGAAMSTVAPWGSRYVSLGTYENEPTVWISGLSLTR